MALNKEAVLALGAGALILPVLVLGPRIQLGSYQLSYYALRVCLSLVAAGLSAFLPGALKVVLPGGIRAGGALAVFALVFWKAPDLVLPAPESGTVILKDGFRTPAESGYVFADKTQVGWYSNMADILAARPTGTPAAQFFIQHDMPPYTNPNADRYAYGGIRAINATSLQDIKCPQEGYLHSYQEARPGQIYCLQTRDGKHYAALRVNEVTEDRIDFSYLFRPDGTSTF